MKTINEHLESKTIQAGVFCDVCDYFVETGTLNFTVLPDGWIVKPRPHHDGTTFMAKVCSVCKL